MGISQSSDIFLDNYRLKISEVRKEGLQRQTQKYKDANMIAEKVCEDVKVITP